MNTDPLHSYRHTLAHILAQAVLEHFPEAKPTLGPPVENGFYYDFDFGGETFGEDDLKKVQKTMRKKLSLWTEFERQEISAKEARKIFQDNQYKLEIIDELGQEGSTITLYTSGGFTDLCKGGHLENPAQEIDAKSFELDRIAGAYWRGDENNTMLTRIYGLAFQTAEELTEYKATREEAKKRDHRKIGKEMDLFTFSDLVGPGLPLWTPKGTLIKDLVMDKIAEIQKPYGYQKVTIPHITKPDLYKTSGHWDKFGDELFKVTGKNDATFVLKPMNCPHHTQIYASQPRSYRDLPLRYMELGVVYRDEQAGELSGLARVRSISMDDGHIFCTPDQIEVEIQNIVKVIKEFYSAFGMLTDGNYWVSLSVRDKENKDKYLGDDAIWDRAEKELEKVAEKEGLTYKKMEGEAAFYGPKLDFMFKDALGRERQLGTAQLDFNMPARFELEYTDSEGSRQTPVMIHRAIAGSIERFLSVMIEHFAGAFPFWLSPVQVKILPISDAHLDYANEVKVALEDRGVRVELDESNNTLGKKIREAKGEKVPYLFVLGDNEVEKKEITVEKRSDLQIEGTMSLEDFISKVDKNS